MAVIRSEKMSDYTIMSNEHLREKDMSLKAKGLLSLMLSLPDDWEYSIKGLCALCKESEAAIRAAIAELKNFGYLEITMKKPNETKSGKIEYEYTVFEVSQCGKPENEQQYENQQTENQNTEIQFAEKSTQLNTKEQITEIQKTEILITKLKENQVKEKSKKRNVENFSSPPEEISPLEMQRIVGRYIGYA